MRILPVVLAILLAAPAAAQQAAADSARVFELYEVEVMPRPQNAPEYAAALQQAYPPQLREAGTGGMVQVAFVVRPDGRVGDVRVLGASDPAFGAPTVQALSLLRFSPAQVGGRPVAVRVEQPITWRVEAAPASEAVAVALPDSIPVLPLDSVDVRPVPRNIREFGAALRALYPAELRTTGATAQVLAGFAIDPQGEPRYAQVLESTDPRFDAATLEAVARLSFQPARDGGAPVWVWMEVPVEWTDPGAAAGGQAAAQPLADDTSAYELDAVEELPRPTSTAAFTQALARNYPPALRDAGHSGRVVVRFRVGTDGRVSREHVVRSTNSAFNMPTLDAVRTLRFRPARLNGQPVPVWVEQPIEWTIAGPAGGAFPPPLP